MNKKYVIGIDSGTTRIKAVIFDLDGNELKSYGVNLHGLTPYENWYEEDMNVLWENAKTCIKEVSSGFNQDEIIGVGISAQGDGLWMIDEKGMPIRAGMCFCDGRTDEIIEKWRADGTIEKAFDICGTAVFGSAMCAEIKWMEKYEPEKLEKAKVFFHLKDWIFYKLTGKIYSDDSDMSIPMFNAKTREYDERLMELFGLQKYRDKFPVARQMGKNLDLVIPEIAKEIGLPLNAVIVGGPMDIPACALSCGVINNGQALTIIGTAAIHSVVMDYPNPEPRLMGMTIAHCKQNRWIRLVSSLCGAPNLEWFLNNAGNSIKEEAKNLGKDVYSYCEEIINSVPIGSNGVVYYPFLLPGGERCPFFKNNIKAGFEGISINTTTHDLLRSVYEGVALAMMDCYYSVPIKLKEIYVSGGGAKSATWMQMFADATGTDIIICEGEEHGARGAAMNCCVAAGYYDGYDQAVKRVVKIKHRFIPNEEKHNRYIALYDLYKTGYLMNLDWWDKRSKFLK